MSTEITDIIKPGDLIQIEATYSTDIFVVIESYDQFKRPQIEVKRIDRDDTWPTMIIKHFKKAT